MPYLPTPNAFLEQSSLLLEAYPDNTRITTKYSYPKSSKNKDNNSYKVSKRQSSTATPTNPEESTSSTASTACATLILKTYNPVTGICLKYKTNKAAEVGRLISGLGKLGAGIKITSSSTTTEEIAGTGAATVAAASPAAMAMDVDNNESPDGSSAVISAAPAVPAAAPSGGGGGGGGKKKKGKGKK